MNKLIKLEKKKAQYERRIRALKDQNFKLQELVHEQRAMIQDQHLIITELSTTHTPYQSPDIQTPTSQQSLEAIETIEESMSLEQEILLEHSEHIQEQNKELQESLK